MSTLQIAEQLARSVHAGQTDKEGHPYSEHLTAVAAAVPTEELKIIAFLHDSVEDSVCDYDRLRQEGFGEEIIAAIRSLTKLADENYWDYIRRVADNDRAIAVKLADLAHNSRRDRIHHPTPRDYARWQKYQKATAYLNEVRQLKEQDTALALPRPSYGLLLHQKLYQLLQEDYQAMCSVLAALLQQTAVSLCPAAAVRGQVKDLDSFTAACLRAESQTQVQCFAKIKDLCSIQVRLQTGSQIRDFCELLPSILVAEEKSRPQKIDSLAALAAVPMNIRLLTVSFRHDAPNLLGTAIDIERFWDMQAEVQITLI